MSQHRSISTPRFANKSKWPVFYVVAFSPPLSQAASFSLSISLLSPPSCIAAFFPLSPSSWPSGCFSSWAVAWWWAFAQRRSQVNLNLSLMFSLNPCHFTGNPLPLLGITNTCLRVCRTQIPFSSNLSSLSHACAMMWCVQDTHNPLSVLKTTRSFLEITSCAEQCQPHYHFLGRLLACLKFSFWLCCGVIVCHQCLERAMKFSYNEFHLWYQLGLSLMASGKVRFKSYCHHQCSIHMLVIAIICYI